MAALPTATAGTRCRSVRRKSTARWELAYGKALRPRVLVRWRFWCLRLPSGHTRPPLSRSELRGLRPHRSPPRPGPACRRWWTASSPPCSPGRADRRGASLLRSRCGRHRRAAARPPTPSGASSPAEPLSLLDVGLAAGDLLDVSRVDPQARKAILQHRPHRLQLRDLWARCRNARQGARRRPGGRLSQPL
jgi:hypothetical protein